MERGKTLNNYTSFSRLVSGFSDEKTNSKLLNKSNHKIKEYFEKTFEDLQSRLEGKTTNVILNGYLNLPLLITDQIYKIFEGHGNISFKRGVTVTSMPKNFCIEKDNFLNGMTDLYFGGVLTLQKITFQIFNLSGNASITTNQPSQSGNHAPSLFKNLPRTNTANSENNNKYNRMPTNTQQEQFIYKEDVVLIFKYLENFIGPDKKFSRTEEIIEKIFSQKDSFSFSEYSKMIENSNSDLFVLLVFYLYTNRPFSESSINFLSEYNINCEKKINKENYFVNDISNYDKDEKSTTRNKSKDKNNEQPFDHDEIRIPSRELSKYIDSYRVEVLNKNNNVINKISNNHNDSNLLKDKEILSTSSGSDNSLISNFHIQSHPKNKYLEVLKYSESGELTKYKLLQKHKDLFLLSCNTGHILEVYPLNGYYIFHNSNPVSQIQDKKLYPLAFMTSLGSEHLNLRNLFLVEDLQELKLFIKSLSPAERSLKNFYEIKCQTGKGAFGVVKIGVNIKTGEKVAIKFIRKKELKEKDLEMLYREIDICKFLIRCEYTHPNIIKVHDVIEDNKYIYIVLEYLFGGSLNEYLKSHAIDDREMKKMLEKISSGLNYLSNCGIVHRDLKPDNIVIEMNNRKITSLKIIDFGLSKIIGIKQKSTASCGSLLYMAPELLLKQPYSKNIDVWSLGIIMYYSLLGCFPFDIENGLRMNKYGNSNDFIKERIINGDLTFPDNSCIHPLLMKLIRRCLERNPDERIDMQEVVKIINDL
jgi:tRNA A-37 threonylcarbamoyl transferase component Bud32